ncbi:hypothetical protein D3C78_1301550 [compost metagenome]
MTAALAAIAQLLYHRLTGLGNVQRSDIFKAEAQHFDTQRKGVGPWVALQKTQMLQSLHHAIGGSLWHVDQAMQLGKSHFLMLLAKRQQQL